MITIKDYAAQSGKTEQAVYKQMKSKKNAERLENHVQIINGKKWLDDFAVSILDESRMSSPVVVIKENQDKEILKLKDEIYNLQNRLNESQSRIIDLQDKLITSNNALADLKEKQLALIEKSRSAEKLEQSNKKLLQENEELQKQFDQELAKPWYRKLFKI